MDLPHSNACGVSVEGRSVKKTSRHRPGRTAWGGTWCSSARLSETNDINVDFNRAVRPGKGCFVILLIYINIV